MRALILLIAGFQFVSVFSQSISIEDIWANYRYYDRGADNYVWANNDSSYAYIDLSEDGTTSLITVDVLTSEETATFIHHDSITPIEITNMVFSPNEKNILLETEPELLYRRSTKAHYLLFHITEGSLDTVTINGKVFNPSFSPNSKHLAYTRNNNLFIYSISTKKETQLTFDGEWNNIINGRTDWVYEEEFEFTKAYCWSSDSKHLTFLKFNEAAVKEYNMQLWGDSLYPKNYSFKYPKAGEDNSKITVQTIELATGTINTLVDETNADNYIPRIQATNNPHLVSIHRLNRLQNQLEILHINLLTKEITTAYKETSATYIELHNDVIYLEDNSLVFTSEESGFRHLYLLQPTATEPIQLTLGNWELDELIGIKNHFVYYTSTQKGETERAIYQLDLLSHKTICLTPEQGVHSGILSDNGKYIIDTHSSFKQPQNVYLRNSTTGEVVKTLVDNSPILEQLKKQRITFPEQITFEAKDKQPLNGYIIKPYNFKKNKKYPVLLYVYGGPGYQTTLNEWGSFNYLWFQHLANLGYIVVSVDPRGTGGKGADFKKQTYGELGKKECEDLIAVAQFLGTQKYCDKTRIGIWGWSFGAYLTSLCLTKGNGVFKCGIAVAPVTNWRFYDTIYTERFLGLPKDNTAGYDENSPIYHADKLKGNYLIIHGTADDNVHFQNALQFESALINKAIPFESFTYPDKNHGIYGGATRYHLYNMMTTFLQKNL